MESFVWVFLVDKSSQSFLSIKISDSLSTSALKMFSKVSFDVAGFGFLLLKLYFSVSEIFNSGFLIWFFILSALKAFPTPDFNVLWSLWPVSILLIKGMSSLNIDWIKMLEFLYFPWLYFLVTILLHLIRKFFHFKAFDCHYSFYQFSGFC